VSGVTPILRTTAPGFARAFAGLRATHAADQRRAETAAAEIVAAVRRRGDAALLAYTKRFDGVALTVARLRVPDADLVAAEAALPAAVRAALRLAARRIRAFHVRQRQASWRYRDAAGLVLGQNITPLRRVGVYVPGGHAAYPSSVLMNVIPARVAGVDEVIMVSPAGRDGHPPAVLAAARIAGATAVYRVGNAYVQAAKRQVYGQVDIDSTAGPSEVLIIADAAADPEYVAADLLAQAEHGSGDESALLLTPSPRLAAAVQRAIARQLTALPRRAAIEAILRKRGALIVTRGLDEAVALAEEVAPEHLELLVRDPAALTRRLRNAGAIFEGAWAPAPLGDYLAGPNHVLPTGGSARFFSPLGTYDFVKRTSVVRGSRAALRRLGPAVETLATLEGYQAHAAAIRVRRA